MLQTQHLEYFDFVAWRLIYIKVPKGLFFSIYQNAERNQGMKIMPLADFATELKGLKMARYYFAYVTFAALLQIVHCFGK